MTDTLINPSARKRRRRAASGASRKVKVERKKSNFVFPEKPLLLLLAAGLVYLFAANFQTLLDKVNTQKIESIVIEGNLVQVDKNAIHQAVVHFLDKSLVSIDLEAIKTELERDPWVKDVKIKRNWPSTLQIEVHEESAIARWGKESLLNQESRIFTPDRILTNINLPLLEGPDGTEKKVMEQYQKFNQLMYPQGLKISRLALNSREAWSMELENGTTINVGKNQVMARMERFLNSIDELFPEQMAHIQSIDLRYNNGIAVSPRPETGEELVAL